MLGGKAENASVSLPSPIRTTATGRDYAKTVLAMYERYPDMTVFCSDYVTLKTRESRDGGWEPIIRCRRGYAPETLSGW